MLDKNKEISLKRFANDIRKGIMTGIASFGAGHAGGSLSIAEVVAVLYGGLMNVNPSDPKAADRDKLVVSKGHAGPAIYAALALRGFFPMEQLKTLNQNGTNLPSHCDRIRTPGIDISTGSLGQGASMAAGFALSDKMDRKNNKTFLILGEGDLNEGQTWEAALFIRHRNLTNLITIVDHNGMQVDGTEKEICNLGDLAGKYRAFGYRVIEVSDGNDIVQVYDAMDDAVLEREQPVVVLLHTVKGKGLSLYEGKVGCHFTEVSEADFEQCMKELNAAEMELNEMEVDK